LEKIDITEEQIQKLLEEVKQEFADMKKAEEAELAKMIASAPAAPKSNKNPVRPAGDSKPGNPNAKLGIKDVFGEGSKPKGPAMAKDSKDEETTKEESSLEKDFGEEKSEGGDAPPAEAASEDAPPSEEAPAEEAAPEGDADPAAEGGDVSPDQLFDMYSKLSDEDLSMHYMACSKALFAKMDAPAEEVEAAPPAAPEAAAPAPEAPAAPAEEAPAAKSDKVSEQVMQSLKKTEQENQELKEEADKLKKKVDELNEVLTKLVSKPARSGLVSGNVIETPPEAPKTLTKSQIMAALAKKAQQPDLSKEDQEKLVRYSLKPVFTEELSKFLEEKQK